MMRRLLFFVLYNALQASTFVEGSLTGQIGNQLFVIAATVSLALDHGAIAVFPDLIYDESNNIPINYKHVFFHLNTDRIPICGEYCEPFYHYSEIPYWDNMRICGYFQSEKYFKHNKEKIIDLFKVPPEIDKYLKNKYSEILAHPNTVSVHVRSYYSHDPLQTVFIQYGKTYLEKAMSIFSLDSLFVIFSNDMKFCKKALKNCKRPLVFIEGEEHYNDLYLMSMCKHNIISNSSFSWWAAYLNPNPNKKVVTPPKWYTSQSGLDDKDVVPDGWIRLNLSIPK